MKSRILQLGFLTASISTGLVLLAGNAMANGENVALVNQTSTTTNITVADSSTTVSRGSSSSTVNNSDHSGTSRSTDLSSRDALGGQDAEDSDSSPLTMASANLSLDRVESAMGQALTSGIGQEDGAIANGGQVGSSVPNVANSPSQTGNMSLAQSAAAVSAIARAVAMQAQANYLPQQIDGANSAGLAFPIATSESPRQPKAPASSGALSDLSQFLSSTLIPYSRHLADAIPLMGLTAVIIAAIICLTIVLLGLIPKAFSDLLRRSGFVNAARSDLANFSSFFATPRVMSLCLAIPPPQDSFFVGVRNINTYRSLI